MLLREIQTGILTFDNEKEVLERCEELSRDNDIVEYKTYKDFSERHKRWVYKISYEKDTLRSNI